MNEVERVLVIDDEADIRDGVSRWLRAAGFEADIAEDGQQGIESARNLAPSAILLDVLMPQKDGMTTLAELRADFRTVGIPVIMLSASLRNEQRALDAGAKFFVVKPFDGKRLVSTVKAALKQREPLTCY